MAVTTPHAYTKFAIKRMAELIKDKAYSLGVEIKLGHAREIASFIAGYKDWNTANALANDGNRQILCIVDESGTSKADWIAGNIKTFDIESTLVANLFSNEKNAYECQKALVLPLRTKRDEQVLQRILPTFDTILLDDYDEVIETFPDLCSDVLYGYSSAIIFSRSTKSLLQSGLNLNVSQRLSGFYNLEMYCIENPKKPKVTASNTPVSSMLKSTKNIADNTTIQGKQILSSLLKKTDQNETTTKKGVIATLLSLFKSTPEVPVVITFEQEIKYPEQPNCFKADDLSAYLNIGRAYSKDFEYLAAMMKSNEYEIQDFDVCNLKVILNSKSKSGGLRFPTIYDFGESVFNREDWSLDTCIKDLERHAAPVKKALDLVYYSWNQSYAWDNGDGSHHMAVAIYHLMNDRSLSRLRYAVKVKEKYVDSALATTAFNEYAYFVIRSSSWYKIYNEYKNNEDINFMRIEHDMVVISVDKNNISRKGRKLMELLTNQNERVRVDLNRYIEDRITA